MGTGARAHKLGRAGGIRWDVGSVEGEKTGDVCRRCRELNVDCAFLLRAAAILEGAKASRR